jgi:hypothetical protein
MEENPNSATGLFRPSTGKSLGPTQAARTRLPGQEKEAVFA